MPEPRLTEDVARDQLARMRGMTALYHRQFFSDVRFVLAIFLVLYLVGWWGIAEAFLLVPFVALWGACQTAFDASYLLFARHYAASLEDWLNGRLDAPILVAGRIEDVYLFPLGARKIVTISTESPLTWFGFMTAQISIGGLLAAGAALWMGGDVLASLSAGARIAYLGALTTLTLAALLMGGWWFLGGAGERNIRSVLSATFG